jgi:hypothetical protein
MPSCLQPWTAQSLRRLSAAARSAKRSRLSRGRTSRNGAPRGTGRVWLVAANTRPVYRTHVRDVNIYSGGRTSAMQSPQQECDLCSIDQRLDVPHASLRSGSPVRAPQNASGVPRERSSSRPEASLRTVIGGRGSGVNWRHDVVEPRPWDAPSRRRVRLRRGGSRRAAQHDGPSTADRTRRRVW